MDLDAKDIPERRAVRTFQVNDAARLTIVGPGRVSVAIGSPATASVTALPADQDRISPKGGASDIEFVFKGGLFTHRGPEEEIAYAIVMTHVRELVFSDHVVAQIDGLETNELSIELKNHSQLTISGLKAGALDAKIEGESTLTLAGAAEHQMIRLKGKSAYRGAQLDSVGAEIKADGESTAEVRVEERIKAETGGGSKLTYTGDNVAIELKSTDRGAIRQG